MANMSIQLKDSSNNNLYPIPPNDYIVEQGTSSIFYYRKWNSGFAEIYGKRTGTTNVTNAFGSGYLGSEISGYAFPFTLTEVFSVHSIVIGPNAITMGNEDASSNKFPTVHYYSPTSRQNASFTIVYEAKGKWK